MERETPKNPSSISNSITLDTVIKRMLLIFAFLLSFGDIKAIPLFEDDYLQGDTYVLVLQNESFYRPKCDQTKNLSYS